MNLQVLVVDLCQIVAEGTLLRLLAKWHYLVTTFVVSVLDKRSCYIKDIYKDHALEKTQVYESFSRFKKEEILPESQLLSGIPSTVSPCCRRTIYIQITN